MDAIGAVNGESDASAAGPATGEGISTGTSATSNEGGATVVAAGTSATSGEGGAAGGAGETSAGGRRTVSTGVEVRGPSYVSSIGSGLVSGGEGGVAGASTRSVRGVTATRRIPL